MWNNQYCRQQTVAENTKCQKRQKLKTLVCLPGTHLYKPMSKCKCQPPGVEQTLSSNHSKPLNRHSLSNPKIGFPGNVFSGANPILLGRCHMKVGGTGNGSWMAGGSSCNRYTSSLQQEGPIAKQSSIRVLQCSLTRQDVFWIILQGTGYEMEKNAKTRNMNQQIYMNPWSWIQWISEKGKVTTRLPKTFCRIRSSSSTTVWFGMIPWFILNQTTGLHNIANGLGLQWQ